MKKIIPKFLSLILISSLTFYGCNNQNENDINENTNNLIEEEEIRYYENISDQDLTNALEREFSIQKGIPITKIDISTIAGIVTLNGTVDNILAKERAEKIAETVKGIREIENNIRVEARKVSDTEIKSNILLKYTMNPATESFDINVDVKNGLVELSGQTQSWQEKNLSENLAKSIKGVNKVNNKIVVSYDSERPDYDIAQDIKESLEWDLGLKGQFISAKVNNGNVKLNGIVPTLYEKRRAIADSWVSNVKSVDYQDLKVKPWIINQFISKEPKKRTDEDIKTAINTLLENEPNINKKNINIEVNNNLVTLNGNVKTLNAKNNVENIIGKIRGVNNIINNLYVENKEQNSNLKDIILNSLSIDPYVDKYEISVDTNNKGIVYLTGLVDSNFEKLHAEDVVSNIEGVSKIENNLKVNNTQISFYTLEPYNWEVLNVNRLEAVKPEKSDSEIQDDIKYQLVWSPFVSENEVNVNVNGGTAILTGVVDTYSEKLSATRNAFEGGAIMVDNKLKVDVF